MNKYEANGSPELDPKEQIASFYSSLDNKEIVTSDGKIIKTVLINSVNTPLAQLKFEGYPGTEADNAASEETEANYVSFAGFSESRTINIEYMILTSPSLANNGVFESTIKLILKNFPQNFKLEAVIINESTERQANSLKNKLDKGLLSEKDLKEMLLRHRLVQTAVQNGFNKFTIIFDRDPEIRAQDSTFGLSFSAEKDPAQKDITIEFQEQ